MAQHFAESLSAPLAEYFFIAGIESSRLFSSDPVTKDGAKATHERSQGVVDVEVQDTAKAGLREVSPHASMEMSKRKTTSAYDKRLSIGSVLGLQTQNKRNSTIVWATPQDLDNLVPGTNLSEEDFDAALRSFVSGRDSALEELQSDAAQSTAQARPKSRIQEYQPLQSRPSNAQPTHKRDKSIGSLRRRLSGMNPLSRSSTTRRTSNRFSKRMSGYNSVIPSPQRLQQDPDTHPLKRSYEPVLLDQYPRKDMVQECQGRRPFPDYVPMFVFPNDVHVMASDERPRSRWHGWTMTGGDGAKLYGMTLISWIPVKVEAAAKLEAQMERWRDLNMSEEEREMARDLGERLAGQRARLSELLTRLPTLEFDTEERAVLQEEISSVEERIALMADVLKPVRHGVSNRIDGLTDGETGYWLPRAYGVLGLDPSLMPFWKEWLRAVTLPMAHGAVLHVPASSPRIGIWQPLEQYVINLLFEAPSPHGSATQVELAIRDLRLYARREAANEIPGSRSTDLWPLFRCIDVADIVVLFEYVLSESRIILLSSHTSLLYSVCAAITQLLFPLKWAGVYIPVLPARLLEALEAPCPYICGVQRRAEPLRTPQDDFVLVDLDQGIIEATTPPTSLPRSIRKKVVALLQQAAPHKYRYGVTAGPPAYMEDAYPHDAFPSENPSVFSARADPSNLARLANLNSAAFGKEALPNNRCIPLLNVFSSTRSRDDRDSDTAAPSPQSYSAPSFADSACFSPALPSQMETSQNLQSTLRDKRFGRADSTFRRTSSVSIVPLVTSRLNNVGEKPSRFGVPSFRRTRTAHAATSSVTSFMPESTTGSQYSPSIYAQSTAASTIMPNMVAQTVTNTETTIWSEGHCLQLEIGSATCSICNERADNGVHKCKGCGMLAHAGCAQHSLSLVCPEAFHPEQIMAAFVRSFASLFYTYRRFMMPTTHGQKSTGQQFNFNMDAFVGSLPAEHGSYITTLRETQAFNEFIGEREHKSVNEPTIKLFDEIILAKRNRGRTSLFSKQSTSYLADKSEHIWRTAAAPSTSGRTPVPEIRIQGRTPAKLDQTLMREPRALQGAPQLKKVKPKRKQVASMLGLGVRSKTEPAGLAIQTDSSDKENMAPL